MYVAFYIERDRSHDTPCATPMGIFYRGEFVHTYVWARAYGCICVSYTCVHLMKLVLTVINVLVFSPAVY